MCSAKGDYIWKNLILPRVEEMVDEFMNLDVGCEDRNVGRLGVLLMF